MLKVVSILLDSILFSGKMYYENVVVPVELYTDIYVESKDGSPDF